ncbi:unnamed protein product [Ceratitis capitata]|uniref:(Mediterranean fruit fly) hypothetical protein n=1 Tax=Ceratitis capitata TaxID=7213 RepID=A0A811UPM1_CERCA|nr:unnamed protein product [Ceratitis capitata]
MRICFDRLCFATKRPATTEHSSDSSDSPHTQPPDRLQSNNEQRKLNTITTKQPPPTNNSKQNSTSRTYAQPWIISKSNGNGSNSQKNTQNALDPPKISHNGRAQTTTARQASNGGELSVLYARLNASDLLNTAQITTTTTIKTKTSTEEGPANATASLAAIDSAAERQSFRQKSTVISGKASDTTTPANSCEHEEYSQFNNSSDSGIGSSLRASSNSGNCLVKTKTNETTNANEVRESNISIAHPEPNATATSATTTTTTTTKSNSQTCNTVLRQSDLVDHVTANGVIAGKETETTVALAGAGGAEWATDDVEQTSKSAANMQQEPNANFQFQPDLGLVNNNSLPALTGLGSQTGAIRTLTLPLQQDVIAQTFIYGTVPPSAAQHINSLQQQELQLQHRYHQLQQLQAQTQGLFLNTNAPGTVAAAAAAAAVAQGGGTSFVVGTPPQLYAATQPTAGDYCSAVQQQKLLTEQMQGLCIAGAGAAPANVTPAGTTTISSLLDSSAAMNILNNSYVPTSPQEERFMQIIQAKELKIQEMQRALQQKDTEIAELKSHLDKFQSVFPFSRHSSTATTPGAGVQQRKSGQAHQRQRAQGISAEPQSESSVLLEPGALPKYDKDER